MTGRSDSHRSRAAASRCPRRARTAAAPRARSFARVPDGCAQAPLCELCRASWTIAPIRRRRSGASFSTCMAKATQPGPLQTPCARRCKSTIICKIAAPTTATSIVFIFRKICLPRKALTWRRSERKSLTGVARVLRGVAERNAPLIVLGSHLPPQFHDFRLCLEIAVIVSLARKINILLLERDPLSEKVHLGKVGRSCRLERRHRRRAARVFSPAEDRAHPCRWRMNGASEAAVPANVSASARGSSFNAAMRILPRPRREAMFEIYSFCRAVDDIADEEGPRPARKQALAQWRRDIDALYARR